MVILHDDGWICRMYNRKLLEGPMWRAANMCEAAKTAPHLGHLRAYNKTRPPLQVASVKIEKKPTVTIMLKHFGHWSTITLNNSAIKSIKAYSPRGA
jgi:hypothetical protein